MRPADGRGYLGCICGIAICGRCGKLGCCLLPADSGLWRKRGREKGREEERASFPHFARATDPPAHQLRQSLADGQSETRPAIFACGGGMRPCVDRPKIISVFSAAIPIPVSTTLRMLNPSSAPIGVQKFHAHGDGAPFGEFQGGVANQIDQNLAAPDSRLPRFPLGRPAEAPARDPSPRSTPARPSSRRSFSRRTGAAREPIATPIPPATRIPPWTGPADR